MIDDILAVADEQLRAVEHRLTEGHVEDRVVEDALEHAVGDVCAVVAIIFGSQCTVAVDVVAMDGMILQHKVVQYQIVEDHHSRCSLGCIVDTKVCGAVAHVVQHGVVRLLFVVVCQR